MSDRDALMFENVSMNIWRNFDRINRRGYFQTLCLRTKSICEKRVMFAYSLLLIKAVLYHFRAPCMVTSSPTADRAFLAAQFAE